MIKDFRAQSVPEELTELTAQEYKMSIRLQADGLFLACYPIQQVESVFFRYQPFEPNQSYTEQVKDCFFKYSWLSYPFKKTTILSSTPINTIIPNSFYDLSRKEQLLQSVFNKQVSHVISENLDFLNGTLLFSMDDELFRFLSRSFNAPLFSFSSSSLLKYVVSKNEKKDSSTLYVQDYGDFVQLIAIKNKEISFFNSFMTSHIHDVMYVTMNAWKYLNLNEEQDRIRLIGNNKFVDSLQMLIENYIKDVRKIQIPQEYLLLTEQAVNVPADLIFHLLCE